MAFTLLDIAKLEARVDHLTRGRFIGSDVLDLINDLRAAIKPSKAVSIQLLEQEIVRLEWRVQDLLISNNKYLQRARDAENIIRASGIAAVM